MIFFGGCAHYGGDDPRLKEQARTFNRVMLGAGLASIVLSGIICQPYVCARDQRYEQTTIRQSTDTTIKIISGENGLEYTIINHQGEK